MNGSIISLLESILEDNRAHSPFVKAIDRLGLGIKGKNDLQSDLKSQIERTRYLKVENDSKSSANRAKPMWQSFWPTLRKKLQIDLNVSN